MLSKAEIEAAVKQHGSLEGAARKLGVSARTLGRRLKHGVSDKGTQPTKAAGRSLAEFRATHDKAYIVPVKIREALKTLGPSGWDYEAPFARLAGVSTADMGLVRDEFAAHIVVVSRDGRRAWAGTPSLAEKMKGMLR